MQKWLFEALVSDEVLTDLLPLAVVVLKVQF